MSDDEAARPKKKTEDVVFVHSPTERGDGFRVIRKRDDTIEVGEMRQAEEGKPLHGELVKLSPREDSERTFDVEVLVPRPDPAPKAADRSGPPQVANDAYRKNWEAIFGARKTPALPN